MALHPVTYCVSVSGCVIISGGHHRCEHLMM
nr:MAG TPA: thionin [Caudoviricetes sp.]